MVPAAFSGLLRITRNGESDPLQNMGNHTLHGHPGWCAKSRTREMVPETIAEHCAMALSLVHAHSLRKALICVGMVGAFSAFEPKESVESHRFARALIGGTR
jgi:hypothetical protein